MSGTSTRRRSLRAARILVVGASGGIGRPLSVALAGRGSHLVLAGRDSSALADLDVGETATFPFDPAVAFGPLDETPIDVLHEIVAVDLVGPLLLARAAIPILPAGDFTLNVSGFIAELPTAGIVPYSAAKAGVSAGFRALAREVRSRGVSVIDARPPHTETGLSGRALHGEPPRMLAGLDPAIVAERLVRAIEDDERDVPGSAFAP